MVKGSPESSLSSESDRFLRGNRSRWEVGSLASPMSSPGVTPPRRLPLMSDSPVTNDSRMDLMMVSPPAGSAVGNVTRSPKRELRRSANFDATDPNVAAVISEPIAEPKDHESECDNMNPCSATGACTVDHAATQAQWTPWAAQHSQSVPATQPSPLTPESWIKSPLPATGLADSPGSWIKSPSPKPSGPVTVEGNARTSPISSSTSGWSVVSRDQSVARDRVTTRQYNKKRIATPVRNAQSQGEPLKKKVKISDYFSNLPQSSQC